LEHESPKEEVSQGFRSRLGGVLLFSSDLPLPFGAKSFRTRVPALAENDYRVTSSGGSLMNSTVLTGDCGSFSRQDSL